jgi:ABC-type cobalamin/Fe3+-siderophores transport system ATPase subunit
LRVNHVSFKIGDTKEFILEDININFEKNKNTQLWGAAAVEKQLY